MTSPHTAVRLEVSSGFMALLIMHFIGLALGVFALGVEEWVLHGLTVHGLGERSYPID